MKKLIKKITTVLRQHRTEIVLKMRRQISGIPNALGDYDDGYRPGASSVHATKKSVKVSLTFDDHTYSGLLTED